MSLIPGLMPSGHIADGFADDCEELIHKCTQKEPLTYNTFCNIWRSMNFASVFHGRISGAEIAELSEELIHVAKRYMVADTSNFEESVAGLFIVYGLLNLQPYSGFAALRLIPDDVPAITRMEVVARRDRRHDVLYILGNVIIKGPTQYHAALREYGMEPSYKKYLEGGTDIKGTGVRPKGVFYRQNEELDIIRDLVVLNKKYTAAKIDLSEEDGVLDRNLNYIDQNMEKELDISLRKIINGIIEEENKDKGGDSSLPEGSDHHKTVEEIKRRAMTNVVTAVKHMTSVEQRATTATATEEIKAPTFKGCRNKSSSGSGSPTKYRSRKSNEFLRPKIHCEEETKKVTSDNTDDTAILNDNSRVENVGLDNTNYNNVRDNSSDTPQEEVCFNLNSLPILIRSQEDNQYIEIEVVDSDKVSKSSTDKEVILAPDVTIRRVSPRRAANKTVDDVVFKKPTSVTLRRKLDKRDYKKPVLKSKFRRMGMLPVANFNEG